MKNSRQLGIGVGLLALTTGFYAVLAIHEARGIKHSTEQLRLTGLASEVANSRLIDGATRLTYTLGYLHDLRRDQTSQTPNWGRLEQNLQVLQATHREAADLAGQRTPRPGSSQQLLAREEQGQLARIATALQTLRQTLAPLPTPAASLPDQMQALEKAAALTRRELTPLIEGHRTLVQKLQQSQIDQLTADMENLLRLSLLAGAVTLALSVILILTMYRQLVAPLQRFEQTARAISAGDTHLRLGVSYRSYSELGTLAAAFDDMLDTLERTTVSRQELESLVIRRTQQLHENEARLRDLFDNTTDLIQSIGPDGSLLYVNRAWQQALGYTEADLPGLKFLDVIAPEHQSHCQSVFARLLAGETLGLFEVNFLTQDGRILPVEGHVSCRLEPGRPPLTRGIFRDISQRRHNADSSRRQMEFLESLHQTTLDLFGQRPLAELLPTLVERAARLLDAPYAEIALLEGDELVVRGVCGPAVCPLGERTPRHQAILSHRALDSGEPVCIEDFSEWEEGRALYKRWGFRAVAVFPILRGDERLGVIAVLRDRPGYAFSADDLRKGRVLSQLTSLVLHNTTIYEEALRAAERKTAALLESERKYRHLVENINQGFYIANARGLLTYCNPAISAVTGTDHHQILGTSCFRLVAEEDRARVITQYRRWAAATVNDATTEFRTVTHDGRRLWVEQITHILRHPDGTVQEFRNFLRDITERKAIATTLQENEERFRCVFDHSPVAIALLSIPEGRIIEINATGLAMFSATREEVIGRTSVELGVWARPEDRDHYLQQLRLHGRVTAFETTLRGKTGKLHEVIYHGSLVQIAGRPYSLNSIQDISTLKQAEQKFRDLFAFAPDAMLIATHEGVITDVNERALSLFGFTRSQLIGQTAAFLIPPAHRPAMLQRLQAYLTAPKPHAMGESAPGLHAWNQAGHIFPIEISLSPLNTSEGQFIVTAVRDISKQLAAEEARRQSEAQLRQTQKIESIGTLAGGIAHDFNNILTGMLGAVEIAQQEIAADHPAHYWLRHIGTAGSRARSLVQQILTFSRKHDSRLVPQPLQPVIAEAVGLLRATIPSMIRIEARVDASCPPVLADSTQIHQVVMNLCTNAWHAVSEDNGLIEITLSRSRITPGLGQLRPNLAPGDYVQLSIRDNGAGMSPEVRERLFEPFFTTKQQGKGTGLGLAVVHGIIQGHQGAIFVHSHPGEGSLFEVFLPSLTVPAAPSRSPLPGTRLLPRDEHVLLVDDDVLSLVALEGMLRHLGCAVRSFTDPAEAFDHFAAHPDEFDVVISDLAMPGLAGPQLATKLLALRPALPVILVSGYIEPHKIASLRSLGIRDIIRKPITLPELTEVLTHHLAPPPVA